MRLMRHTGEAALIVRAAHSRRIEPNEVVDVDEVIGSYGGAYTLEQALMGDAAAFEPVAAADTTPASESTEPKRRGKK